MAPSRINLFIYKVKLLKTKLRVLYWRLKGLRIAKGKCFIGSISCEWPGSVEIGVDCYIEDGVDFKIVHPFFNTNYIRFGDNLFIGRNCEFHCKSSIVVGNNCMIASSTTFVDVGHTTLKAELINKQHVFSKEIVVADDVWIGTGCTVLMGVTIGDGAVIAAGSLVNKAIPPYQIWGGVPAKFIKNRD